MTRRCRWMSWSACALTLAILPSVVLAAPPAKSTSFEPQGKQVEMFQAISDGQIEVKLIPRNSTEARILITNKTKEPLSVKLPNAFAGIPAAALAQFAPAGGVGGGGIPVGGGGGAGNFGGGGNNNQNQSMGGGMGGMGGMGMFNVAPEKVGKLKVPTVCLEHGKNDPAPNIPYVIKPIETFTTKPGVREVCEMLGTGKLSQRVAQAAAWNLSNDMTWQQLAMKQVRHINGIVEPYFNPMELQAAMQIAVKATELAKQREASSAEKSEASMSQQ